MYAPYVMPHDTLKVLVHIRHRKKNWDFQKILYFENFHLCRLGAHTFCQIYIFVRTIYGSYSIQNISFLYRVEMQKQRGKKQYKKIWGNFSGISCGKM
jgi:hypothetical protein